MDGYDVDNAPQNLITIVGALRRQFRFTSLHERQDTTIPGGRRSPTAPPR
jgi:hypothetical protein